MCTISHINLQSIYLHSFSISFLKTNSNLTSTNPASPIGLKCNNHLFLYFLSRSDQPTYSPTNKKARYKQQTSSISIKQKTAHPEHSSPKARLGFRRRGGAAPFSRAFSPRFIRKASGSPRKIAQPAHPAEATGPRRVGPRSRRRKFHLHSVTAQPGPAAARDFLRRAAAPGAGVQGRRRVLLRKHASRRASIGGKFPILWVIK